MFNTIIRTVLVLAFRTANTTVGNSIRSCDYNCLHKVRDFVCLCITSISIVLVFPYITAIMTVDNSIRPCDYSYVHDVHDFVCLYFMCS